MTRILKLLIVEDSADDAELVMRILRRAGFELDWVRVETEEQLRTQLHPDVELVISDYRLPELTGFRALEVIRQLDADVPFILVSGTIGASDYLMKDRLSRLGSAVSHALEESRLRKERKHSVAEAERQLAELRRWQEVMVNREERLATLKSEVDELLSRLGEPRRYHQSDDS